VACNIMYAIFIFLLLDTHSPVSNICVCGSNTRACTQRSYGTGTFVSDSSCRSSKVAYFESLLHHARLAHQGHSLEYFCYFICFCVHLTMFLCKKIVFLK
jgi:hypothetical protein